MKDQENSSTEAKDTKPTPSFQRQKYQQSFSVRADTYEKAAKIYRSWSDVERKRIRRRPSNVFDVIAFEPVSSGSGKGSSSNVMRYVNISRDMNKKRESGALTAARERSFASKLKKIWDKMSEEEQAQADGIIAQDAVARANAGTEDVKQ